MHGRKFSNMKKIIILLGIIATINFLSSCESSDSKEVNSEESNKADTLYDYNGDTINRSSMIKFSLTRMERVFGLKWYLCL